MEYDDFVTHYVSSNKLKNEKVLLIFLLVLEKSIERKIDNFVVILLYHDLLCYSSHL